ncbi:cytochrome b/b6 domain-containing protein [Caldithrix abyssi]
MKRIYMYSVAERIWHWVQALAIILLIITGFEVHFSTWFKVFGFTASVYIHKALGFLLLGNAFLGFFYHISTGLIKQFIPRPRGFFDGLFLQARYYLYGIFKGEPHPFEKTPLHKLNPLQKIVYFGLLNVLLPLQVLTGVLMWGSVYFPETFSIFGGLPVLAPLHTLGAYLFIAFIIVHVYMTTLGPTPCTMIKAMINGYEEIPEDEKV